jgi:hypothetical protein
MGGNERPYHLGTRSGNEGCMRKAAQLNSRAALEAVPGFPSGALGLEQIEGLVEHFVALGGGRGFVFIILG